MSARRASAIFVGNLPWTVAHKELGEYFSQFGRIKSARVQFNRKTGLSHGYGFVTYSHERGAEAATNHGRHILEGNFLKIDAAGSRTFTRRM